MKPALILAYALATDPVPNPYRLPDPVDGPRLTCMFINDAGAMTCTVTPAPLAPEMPMRPAPNPHRETVAPED